MSAKDIAAALTAVVGVLVSLLIAAVPSIIEDLPVWLQNRSKEGRREATVDFAKRRVDFLSAWLQACQQSNTSVKLTNIKKSVAEELKGIKKDVNRSLYIPRMKNKWKEPKVLWSLVPPLTLMKINGVLSLALPIVVALGGLLFNIRLQTSIVMYYFSPMRDVLVILYILMGICLLLYKGYNRFDGILGDLGCVFAIGMALFPAAAQVTKGTLSYYFGVLHNEFFFFFFWTLGVFSAFLFTKTRPDRKPGEDKRKRNWIYKTCGYLIFICVPLIAICLLVPAGIATSINRLHTVFWLESIAFVAVGVSWLTKGETILKDEAK